LRAKKRSISIELNKKMKTIYITRRETFNAAHKLYQPNWTEEENNLVFGKCANKNWHGHNFTLFVTVKGVPNKETGFVMNLKTLSEIINARVIESLDHKNLNLDVSYLTGIMASTENLAIAIWDQLANEIAKNGGELAKIKLIETENNFVEYFGGKEPF
jgi:6-pyruvoyltetrahydropterin/6-carboxytetrahydropterin synthase